MTKPFPDLKAELKEAKEMIAQLQMRILQLESENMELKKENVALKHPKHPTLTIEDDGTGPGSINNLVT